MLLSTHSWTHLGPIVGRQRELDRLRDLVEQPGIVTVTGPGGIGKTRLVGALLDEQIVEHPVAFVDLDYALGGGGLADVVARVLVGEAYSALDPVGAIVQLVRDDEFLLVLDGFDPDTDGVADLLVLHERCPRLRLVVTALRRLGVKAERVLDVGPLPLPDADDPWASPAMVLLDECLERSGRPIDRQADTPALAEICRRAAGLPLALELVAGWALVYPPAELARLVGSSLEFFSGGGPDLPERQRDLRALIGLSIGQLADRHRLVLAAVAALPGGIDHALLVEICPDGAMADLRFLVERHLVISVSEPAARFDLLDTVRLWVEQELGHLVDASRARLRAKVCEQVATWGPLVGTSATTSVIRQIARLDALHAATVADLAAVGDPLAVDVVVGLTAYWMYTARIADGLAALRLADTPQLAPYARAEVAIARARLLNHASDTRARGEADLALTLAAGGPIEQQARARIVAARSLWLASAEAEALAVLGTLDDRRSELPDDMRRAVDLELVVCHYNAGDVDEAWRILDERVGRQLDDAADLPTRLDAIGLRLMRAVYTDETVAADTAAVASAALAGCDWPFAEAIRLRYWLTLAALRSGDVAGAVRYSDDALAAVARTGVAASVASAWSTRTSVMAAAGRFDEMRHALVTAIDLFLELGNSIGTGNLLVLVSEFSVELGFEGPSLLQLMEYVLPYVQDGDAGLTGTVRTSGLVDAIARAGMRPDEVDAARAVTPTLDRQVGALHWVREHVRSDRPGIDLAGDARFADISTREMDILRLLAEGRSDQEIADRLVVGVRTVNTHVLNIRRKLQAPNRRAAADLFRRASV